MFELVFTSEMRIKIFFYITQLVLLLLSIRYFYYFYTNSFTAGDLLVIVILRAVSFLQPIHLVFHVITLDRRYNEKEEI